MDKQVRFNMLINSVEVDCSHGNSAGKSILGKRRIEEHCNKNDPLKGSMKSIHISSLQKPIRPSAVRDFPLGCGRYASPAASESYIFLSQKCLTPLVSASGDYPSGYGRNVPPMTEEKCLLTSALNSHTNRVKYSRQQLSKLNNPSIAKESLKFRAILETNCVKQEDGAKNREKKNILPSKQAWKESCYLSKHPSEQGSRTWKPSKVRPKRGNINGLANVIKKEVSLGLSTINVEGLCSPRHNTHGNTKVASYKIVATPNTLCFKIVRTSNQLSTSKFGTNSPELAPSRALANIVPMIGEPATRSKVRETLRSFQVVCRKMLQNEEARVEDPTLAGKRLRVDLMAAKLLRDNNIYVNTGKQLVGAVPGLEVGDQFHYRIELCIVGLHRQVQAGIDFLKRGSVQVATSIVASGGYEDDLDSGDVLIYTGQGGNNYRGDKRQFNHQKLERGNLALKNSIDRTVPVRVIRGFKQNNTRNQGKKSSTVSVIYTYDGLYDVEKYWLDNGASGYSVFKFQLRRQPGQPQLGLKTVQFTGSTKKHSISKGLRLKDISEGKESNCICAVNTVDEENGPPQFVYTTKVIYPSWCQPIRHRGCDCSDGCLNPSKCLCALKNGGEFPFNYDGAIVRSKPIVYECGSSCSCPPTCHNRVSQHGVRYNLEVFKTDKRGWGVRSSESIPSGSFICEYTGELLFDTEAEQCVGNDEYLFDIGRNCNSKDQSLWSDLYSLMPEIAADEACDIVDDVGFTVDAAKYGNVGRFVNHSCSPNLYAQNVLYDHDDRRLPHIMLFAAENIPPMRELFYHYNYSVDQVYDCHGNIKKKLCFCGSSECIGRMY